MQAHAKTTKKYIFIFVTQTSDTLRISHQQSLLYSFYVPAFIPV